MGRTGGQKGESLPVTEHYRAPFNSIAARPLLGTIPVELYAPQMPAIDVIAIRVEKNGFLVKGDGPLLDFTVAGSQESRRAAVGRESVQMLPAVFFRGHHDLVVGGPIQDATASVFGHEGKGTLGRSTAVPDFFCGSRRCVRDPNG